MKFAKLFLVGIFSALLLVGCGSKANKSDTLVVYSPNSEDLISAIVPLFEKETGIKVEVISAGTGELMKRIESEQNSPYADVMFGGTKSVHLENINLFQEYVSPNDKNLIKEYQNDTKKVTSYVLDGNVLLVNTNLLGDIEINGYMDLLNPALKGKIAHTDAASSSSAFNHITNMLLAIGGDYESEAGWDYVAQFVANLDGKIASGSGAVHKSVADGEFVVGLTWEDPAVGYLRTGAAPVKVVHPVEGTTYSASATSIVNGSPNLENAKKFVDFLLSKEVQDTIGANLNNRPLHVESVSADYMTPMSDIKLVFEDLEYVMENKQKIVDRYIDILTSN